MIDFDTNGMEAYVSDTDLEKEGVWVEAGGRRFKIRRAGGANTEYQRVAQTKLKPYKRQLDRGTLDPAKTTELMRELYVQTIITGWEDVTAHGQPVEFNAANVRAFLVAFPEVLSELMDYAGEMATFQEREIEEAVETLGES